NCGISLAPLAVQRWPPPPMELLGGATGYRFDCFQEYGEPRERRPPPTNAALLVGQTTLRHPHPEHIGRAATPDERAPMTEPLEQAMTAGAIGLSTGLDYPAARPAPTEEVVHLATAAAAHRGLYVTHTRDYFDAVEEALDEAF